MIEHEQIFKHLAYMAEKFPSNLYWLDLNHKIIGANQKTLDSIGAKSKEEIIGKTAHDIYPKHVADSLWEHVQDVMRTKVDIKREHAIKDISTKKLRYYSDTISPIFDDDGNIIGIIGTSIEITAEKEAEQLKHDYRRLELQNKLNEMGLEKEEQFRKIVGQMVHDIQSPLSSIGTIVEESIGSMPEKTRVTLRNAAARITDIANNLLNQHQNKDTTDNKDEILLVSLALLHIMSEKRYQYTKNKNITFELNFEKLSYFAFIKINSYNFKRMISNLVNNAAEALKDKPTGKITIELGVTPTHLVIWVKDNGYGMPKHIQEKFYTGETITEGKEAGRGIGLTQVLDTIKSGNGNCDIYANEDVGTKVVIKFNKVTAPYFITSEIKLTKDDTVIILDDDDSIHGAWDAKFKSVLEKATTLKIKHFTQGKEVICYVNSLSDEQKQDIFLLTDFELLNQGIHGLEVATQTGLKRVSLVTSYSDKPKIQDLVIKAGIKLLPKELTSAVSIIVDKKIPKWSKKVDIVWVEDQKWFIDETIEQFYSHLKIDTYYDPISFMEDIHQYPLDTRIILDTYYYAPDGTPYLQDGFSIARELHEMGYTKLLLFSGEAVEQKLTPEYLTVILKDDLEGKKNLDKL
jgi:PAS domain S-box-containing protein